MSDPVSKLHLAIQQLSVAMFTGLGVTQRDASEKEPPNFSGDEGGSTEESTSQHFRDSVADLSKDVARRAKDIFELLEQVDGMEEEAKQWEDSLFSQERDSLATERLKEEWKESCRLYEVLKNVKVSSEQGGEEEQDP
ncbi:hypothetical protein GAYE_SCF65G6770 [Galdieria yellowstonensis]|uniref:Mediator of RNA polymerase II transcription subunit 21 n=1 Tax=Galdieria yellowstonensis TaxID=3028027 RepID=A0AAV9INH7_9RHOD|nr:hypothetical protein GAYE_SCF65G6770 [Galdieria yellowstonensis]